MSKVKNGITKVEKANNTNKPPSWKLHPVLVKRIGSVLLAGFSLLIKYQLSQVDQLPQVLITISTDVCQLHQQNKIVIKVDFGMKKN
jgi:hypothetical protein